LRAEVCIAATAGDLYTEELVVEIAAKMAGERNQKIH
jgi:hypothetical protein